MPLRITPSVAEQEGQQTETEATGAPQKHHYTLNQQVGSITKKVDTLLALIDEPISSLLVKLVPYLPTLLVIINMLKAGVEQYCQLHLAEEPPVDK